MSFHDDTEGRTIVDEWEDVEAPPRPKLEAVTLEPKSSAILVLDILRQNCTAGHAAPLRSRGSGVCSTMGATRA